MAASLNWTGQGCTITACTLNGADIQSMGGDLLLHGGDSFTVSYKVRNTGNSGFRSYSVDIEYVFSSGSTSHVSHIVGSGGGAGGGVPLDKYIGAGAYQQFTFTVTPTDDEDFPAAAQVSKVNIRLYFWAGSSVGAESPYGYLTHELTDGTHHIRYAGASHSPTITAFSVVRNGNETTQLLLTAKGTRNPTGEPEDPSHWILTDTVELTMDTGDGFEPIADTISLNELLQGVTARVMETELPTSQDARFRLRFYNAFEQSKIWYSEVSVPFANLHLAGYRSGGVAVGKFSTSTENNPKFESAFPAFFDAGIHDMGVVVRDMTLGEEFENYDSSERMKLVRAGNLVLMSGRIKPTAQIASAGTATIASIPNGFRPVTSIYQRMQSGGHAKWFMRIENSVIGFERHGTASGNSACTTAAELPVTAMWITTDEYPEEEE